jgi:hypothetical protein
MMNNVFHKVMKDKAKQMSVRNVFYKRPKGQNSVSEL